MSHATRYIPARGHVVHLNLAGTAGHELDGPHFALVISRRLFHTQTGLATILVGSSQPMKIAARAPLSLQLPKGLIKTSKNPEGIGFIRCDEVRTIDFSERNVRLVAEVDNDFVNLAIDRFLTTVDEEE